MLVAVSVVGAATLVATASSAASTTSPPDTTELAPTTTVAPSPYCDFPPYATTTTTVAATTSSTATTAATTTTAPPTTTTSTTPSGSTTTTLPATTTTLDPVEAEKAAVVAGVQATAAVRAHIGVDPDDPTIDARLDATYASDGVARGVVDRFLEFLRENGYRVCDNPTYPTAIAIEDVALLDGPPSTRADVTICFLDSAVIYEPDGGPDGLPAIVNDEIISARTTWHMLREHGRWKLAEANRVEEWQGELECRPA